ncbi:MAG: hypothetical protein O3B24_01175 [Verrucomicrobia bacterium]|nr:hypothetical protein [Verrucomicrobiota bacterium]
MKSTLLILLGLLCLDAWADDPRPVVQIPGRSDTARPVRTSVITPQVIQLQTSAPPPAESAHPVEASGVIAVPVGAIVAWVNIFTNQAGLPRGWMSCDGQVVDDPASPLVGQMLPDLNNGKDGEGRFLRGAQSAGAVGGAATHAHAGYRSQKYGTQRSPVSAPTPESHLPPYYDVIWIMRVR